MKPSKGKREEIQELEARTLGRLAAVLAGTASVTPLAATVVEKNGERKGGREISDDLLPREPKDWDQ